MILFPLDINLEGELLDHTVVLYSAIKKGNLVICDNVDKTGWHYAKWNKSRKDKYCMITVLCGI